MSKKQREPEYPTLGDKTREGQVLCISCSKEIPYGKKYCPRCEESVLEGTWDSIKRKKRWR